VGDKPNPKRVASGRENRKLAGPLTAAGRAQLREAALRNRPWTFSTGPTSVEGKRRAALNGKTRQTAAVSVREHRRELAAARALIGGLIETRRAIEKIA